MENFKLLTLAGLMATAPVLALANVGVGETLGTTEGEIRSVLEAQGYTIEEIEFEDGEIEVEFTKDGVETELVLDDESGVVTAIEIEQDDD